jgi:hypothetical protein
MIKPKKKYILTKKKQTKKKNTKKNKTQKKTRIFANLSLWNFPSL